MKTQIQYILKMIKFAHEIVWFSLLGSQCINIQEICLDNRIGFFNGITTGDNACDIPGYSSDTDICYQPFL